MIQKDVKYASDRPVDLEKAASAERRLEPSIRLRRQILPKHPIVGLNLIYQLNIAHTHFDARSFGSL